VSLPLEAPAAASPLRRLRRIAASRTAPVEATALALAVLVFLASVLPNLANHPTLTDDEAWVMSASYKLAKDGVFGSDMFRDFYGADSHYYFNMPGHHLVLAAVFRVIGAGVVQARLVGIAYGLATILLAYSLARRLYGVTAALLSLVLLLFLRMNMGFDTGLPLQELAANIRYDLAPVPFMLAGFLLLLGGASGPSPDDPDAGAGTTLSVTRAALAGLLFGVATLLQFYGAFAIPVAIAFLALERLPRKARFKLIGSLAGASVLVVLPYGIYALAHFDDYRGQVSTVDRRDDFGDPLFYLRNFVHEPDRFLRPLGFKEVPKGEDPRLVEPRFLSLREMLTRRPSAKLAVLFGLPLALAFTGWRGLQERRRGDRLLFLALAGVALQFALFDSLKLYIYWIPMVPLLCIALAPVLLRLLEGFRRSAPSWAPLERFGHGRTLRLGLAAVTAVCLLGVLAEGTQARVSGIRTSSDETKYARLGDLIHESVPAGSRVAGSTSLWWAMRDTDYRSYFMFFYVTSPHAGPYRNSIGGFLEDSGTEYMVLTRLGREELEKHLAPADRRDLEAFQASRGTLIKRIDGAEAKSYGYIEIWRLR
jgi:4-amino-4-deoxy-L-arabinose transferase-like glycosyltransferase